MLCLYVLVLLERNEINCTLPKTSPKTNWTTRLREENCSHLPEPAIQPQLFVPNGRVVESGNGGCPGGTLVPCIEVRHFQFCTKRYRYHARIVQSFTCFHTGLACSRSPFAMVQRFIDLEDTPLCLLLWHLCVPKSAELTSLRGLFAPLSAGFRRLWPPTC